MLILWWWLIWLIETVASVSHAHQHIYNDQLTLKRAHLAFAKTHPFKVEISLPSLWNNYTKDTFIRDTKHHIIYQVFYDQELGRGHYGIVYAARNLVSQTAVAIKILTRHPSSNQVKQEYQLNCKMNLADKSLGYTAGPIIQTVFHFHDSGLKAIPLERIFGRTLEEELLDKHSKLDPVSLYVQARRAIDEFHLATGYFHSDTHCRNFMVKQTMDSPQVVLIDFGLAQKIKGSKSINAVCKDYQLLGQHAIRLLQDRAPHQPDLQQAKQLAMDDFTLSVSNYEFRRHFMEILKRA